MKKGSYFPHQSHTGERAFVKTNGLLNVAQTHKCTSKNLSFSFFIRQFKEFAKSTRQYATPQQNYDTAEKY